VWASDIKRLVFFLTIFVVLVLHFSFFSVDFKEEQEIIDYSQEAACTSFCLPNGDHCIFGSNMDHGTIKVGRVFVNKRNLEKIGWEASISGVFPRWVSEYGSVSFNIMGPQLVWSGMNEAGLMISTMSLVETEDPAPDERPPLASPLWLQFQLDVASTVQEVLDNASLFRIKDGFDHYLVCDRGGVCAVLEFLHGEMVAYTGSSLPVPALSNSTYQDSLTALEDRNFWKIKVLSVKPGGPADQAGLEADDWIISVDGLELSNPDSEDIFHGKISQLSVGDEVSFDVIREGESAPLTITIKLDPLPEDTSMYVLPAGVPIQIVSLGFLPRISGDFLVRFVTAADWINVFDPASSDEAVSYAFDTLGAVSREDTIWSLVYDPVSMRVYFSSYLNKDIRYLNFESLDFSCTTPQLVLDIHQEGTGDIWDELMEYSHHASFEYGKSIVKLMWQVEVSAFFAESILTGFESYRCLEDPASMFVSLPSDLENYKPLVPPAVHWAVLAAARRIWPYWALVEIVSLAIFFWARCRKSRYTENIGLIWIITILFLGPFGLAAFYWKYRTKKPEVSS
jgi:penicillin V acylase-like amidase (Ntn superfamily)